MEFRFEEIRSVGYFVCGQQQLALIPEKPKILTVNFRSHSGILLTAAAILMFLFDAFPDSTKQLKEDRGIFSGPRPGVFPHVSYECLREAISVNDGGGIKILTHDANVHRCKEALGDYPLVYGIREAKGLEFDRLLIVDFFCELPQRLQKPWRELLLGRTSGIDYGIEYPEIEGHLKLLYTAVTRSMERLFFAETIPSLAGDAFVRWITEKSGKADSGNTTKALATLCNIDEMEELRQTPDDWRSDGFVNATTAETLNDLEEADSFIEKAIFCFERAKDKDLSTKARLFRCSVSLRARLVGNPDLEQENTAQPELEQEVA